MNAINGIVTDLDKLDGNGKSPCTLADEILQNLVTALPYSTTFVNGISQDEKVAVEAQLKRSFELWANTWVAPYLRQIMAKEMYQSPTP